MHCKSLATALVLYSDTLICMLLRALVVRAGKEGTNLEWYRRDEFHDSLLFPDIPCFSEMHASASLGQLFGAKE